MAKLDVKSVKKVYTEAQLKEALETEADRFILYIKQNKNFTRESFFEKRGASIFHKTLERDLPMANDLKQVFISAAIPRSTIIVDASAIARRKLFHQNNKQLNFGNIPRDLSQAEMNPFDAAIDSFNQVENELANKTSREIPPTIEQLEAELNNDNTLELFGLFGRRKETDTPAVQDKQQYPSPHTKSK